MKVALIMLVGSFAMTGCRKTPEDPEPPSDPTDMFFRWEGMKGAKSPPFRFHERMPGRLFATTLRPTRMTGSLPTAYLSRITRNYQPWAARIYDVAQGGFDLKTMSPLSPEKGLGPYDLIGHEIQIELGGWSRSGDPHPRWMSKIYKGRVETRAHDVFVTDEGWAYHYFTQSETSDFNGLPVTVSCAKVVGCRANLTIPPEMANLPPITEEMIPGRPAGARLAIAFRSERIDDWPEIRRKAVCFAAFSIPHLEAAKIAPVGRLRCNDVRKAIAETMGRR